MFNHPPPKPANQIKLAYPRQKLNIDYIFKKFYWKFSL